MVRLGADRLSRWWEIGRDPDEPPSKQDGWETGPPPDEVLPRLATTDLRRRRAPADVAGLLGLAAGAAVLVRRWSQMAGDTALQMVTSYVPWGVAQEAQLMQIRSGQRVHAALADSGHRIVRFTDEVHESTSFRQHGVVVRGWR